MKTGIYRIRLYTAAKDWPRNKLMGFFGAQIPEGTEPIEATLELYEKEGIMKAVQTMPNGKQRIGSLTCTKYSAAWEAFAGEHGGQVFQFLMTASDSSNAVWGFAAGKSDFRGFIGFEGEYLYEKS